MLVLRNTNQFFIDVVEPVLLIGRA